MFSSAHNTSTKKVTRKQAGGKSVILQKPIVLYDYSKNIGQLTGPFDRAYHYSASGTFFRKPMKWWETFFFFLLKIAIMNSFTSCDTCSTIGT